MKAKIVRVCSWFTLIFFGLTSVVGLIMFFIEDFNISGIVASVTCLFVAANGWYARKFGLPEFKIHVASKPIAVVSLIFGIALVTLVPILFANSFGFVDSWLAIRNLQIMFLPVVISAIAVLSSKSGISADDLIVIKKDKMEVE
ncbi:MAG TPA: hypothetical protein VK589_04160 [Chryseolinea sp.]|nr:hypothetical protein [Chryseolinea sp.]